ncbi:hypothetical protein ACHAPT_013374 [Fusarium lateritium]
MDRQDRQQRRQEQPRHEQLAEYAVKHAPSRDMVFKTAVVLFTAIAFRFTLASSFMVRGLIVLASGEWCADRFSFAWHFVFFLMLVAAAELLLIMCKFCRRWTYHVSVCFAHAFFLALFYRFVLGRKKKLVMSVIASISLTFHVRSVTATSSTVFILTETTTTQKGKQLRITEDAKRVRLAIQGTLTDELSITRGWMAQQGFTGTGQYFEADLFAGSISLRRGGRSRL